MFSECHVVQYSQRRGSFDLSTSIHRQIDLQSHRVWHDVYQIQKPIIWAHRSADIPGIELLVKPSKLPPPCISNSYHPSWSQTSSSPCPPSPPSSLSLRPVTVSVKSSRLPKDSSSYLKQPRPNLVLHKTSSRWSPTTPPNPLTFVALFLSRSR